MTRLRRLVPLTALTLLALVAPASAQEPQTREQLLRLKREQKAISVEPPQSSGLERLLLRLENGRLFERLLNPAEGVYPRVGNVTAGSGIAFGPGYRRPNLFGGHADFSAFASGSTKQYWMLEGRLQFPRLADDKLLLDGHVSRYEFPEEPYFGLGAESDRRALVTYGLLNTVAGATAGYRPVPWLTISGTVDALSPSVSSRNEPGSIQTRFGAAGAPGLLDQPGFVRYEASTDVNYGQPRGNPRNGGRYMLGYQWFDDTDTGLNTFRRVEADLRQYISLLRERRVLALRALVSVSDADAGREIPFYFQRTLGGPDDLRGFRRFRFRDRNLMLFQAEYRWEIFTAVDGAIFYDAGKVAAERDDLSLDGLESDYGIGFRFGTRNGVFLRVEGAFGSSGGKHFIFRFGDAF